MQKEMKIGLITTFLVLSLATISSVSAANIYNVNESTYSNYFNTTGYVNNPNVHSGDVLDFSGTLTNKDMYISIPLNLTSTDQTGTFINGTITILATGSGTNITNLKFNTTNHNGNIPGTIVINQSENNTIKNNTITTNQTGNNSYGIHLIGANNNQIIGNTITTTGDGTGSSYGNNGKFTYGVYLENSNSNIFDSNTIKTTGASADVDWTPYPNPGIYPTIGTFLANDSSNNQFTNNTITTDYNNVVSAYSADTLTGVRIYSGTGNRFTGNHINTNGNSYLYGIEIVGISSATASNNIISGNIINTTGDYNSQSVKISANTLNTTISQNIIKSVANSISYGVYLEGSYTSPSDLSVTITGNKISTIGNINYIIELFSANNNNITNNVLVGTGNYSLGIGTYKSNNNTIKFNTITTIGDNSAKHIPNGDAIPEGNDGIKLFSNSNQNIIQHNIITSSAEYAINSAKSSTNTITNNYLVSDNDNKQGNEAVTSGTGDTVIGNYGKKPTADFTVNTNEGIKPLIVQFIDTSQGDITNWAWDFTGDGVVDCVAQYSTYTYTKPGTYAAKLTVTGPGGSNSKIIYITVKSDTTAPVPKVNIKSGLYKNNQIIKLTATDNIDSHSKIYYTTNGTIPTTSSKKYTSPITITTTTILKYFAIDQSGNKSSVYTQKYTVDKVAPKVIKTIPARNSTNFSLTAPVTIKFNENISKGVNFGKIYLKNMNTGKLVSIVTSITGNTLTIKQTTSRLHNNTYQLYIPTAALKDNATNNVTKYTLKFKSQ